MRLGGQVQGTAIFLGKKLNFSPRYTFSSSLSCGLTSFLSLSPSLSLSVSLSRGLLRSKDAGHPRKDAEGWPFGQPILLLFARFPGGRIGLPLTLPCAVDSVHRVCPAYCRISTNNRPIRYYIYIREDPWFNSDKEVRRSSELFFENFFFSEFFLIDKDWEVIGRIWKVMERIIIAWKTMDSLRSWGDGRKCHIMALIEIASSVGTRG